MNALFPKFSFSKSALCALPLMFALEGTAATWIDVTAESGLDGYEASRVKFADLNNDGRPDVVILHDGREDAVPAVFLQQPNDEAGARPTFEKLSESGLPPMRQGDVVVFADLDNDGVQDAVIGRYLDIYQDDYEPRPYAASRTAWLPGNGDGTFGKPRLIPAAKLATTRAVAVGDVNEDGLPDLFLGNWYQRYFTGYEGFSNDLLLQVPASGDDLAFTRWPIPMETAPTDYTDDLGGRPTYGTLMPRLDDGLPMLLELNYGRRWNRLYEMAERQHLQKPNNDEEPAPFVVQDERARADHLVRQLTGKNIAAEAQVDGDAIRHGRHPVWPEEHARAQSRSRRDDEPLFRANGNTFDAAVGDIDNDGDFDLFLSTIIHAWAGESSDRSRFLVNQLKETGHLRFESFARLSVDRIPELPPAGEPLDAVHTNYNQGDIYAELADLNHDGRLDLILCSSDYADPAPHDERLRIYLQQADGRFADRTKELGIDHMGAGMPSLADVDGDGDLDLLIGQSFNRFTPEMRRDAAIASGALTAESPGDARPERRVRLFLNELTEGRASLMLDLEGDPETGVTRDAYGAIVRVTADLDGDPATPDVTQIRQLLGPGGHAGKQHTLAIHIGLGEAKEAKHVEIVWPGDNGTSEFENLAAGRYTVRQGESIPHPMHD